MYGAGMALLAVICVVYGKNKKKRIRLPAWIGYPAWIIFTAGMTLVAGYIASNKDAKTILAAEIGTITTTLICTLLLARELHIRF